MTPSPKGATAKNPYAGKDDFAKIVGVTRSRIHAWTRTENPAYPEAKNRRRLAELSGGRYTPDDFARPGHPVGVSPTLLGLQLRQEALEAQVVRLTAETRHLTDLSEHREDQIERLAAQVEALAHRIPPAAGQTRKTP